MVIPNKIKVSFQTKAKPTPFNIIPFMMMINHFAGITLLITCSGNGILVIGNINPDNKITGSINPIKEIIIAVCCVSEMVEINIPKASDEIINKILSKPNKKKLPCTGILKTKMLNKIITTALITDKRM